MHLVPLHSPRHLTQLQTALNQSLGYTFRISVTTVPYLCIDLGFYPLDLQAAVASSASWPTPPLGPRIPLSPPVSPPHFLPPPPFPVSRPYNVDVQCQNSHPFSTSPISLLRTLGTTSMARTMFNGSANSRPSLPPSPSPYATPVPHHKMAGFLRVVAHHAALITGGTPRQFLYGWLPSPVYSRHLFLRGGAGSPDAPCVS